MLLWKEEPTIDEEAMGTFLEHKNPSCDVEPLNEGYYFFLPVLVFARSQQ
jgi:hypothetical protein